MIMFRTILARIWAIFRTYLTFELNFMAKNLDFCHFYDSVLTKNSKFGINSAFKKQIRSIIGIFCLYYSSDLIFEG